MKKIIALCMLVFAMVFSAAFTHAQVDARIKDVYSTHQKHLFLTEDGTLFITGNDSPNTTEDSGSTVPYFLDHNVEKVRIDYSFGYQLMYMKKDGTVWARNLRYSYGYNSWPTSPRFIMDGARDIFLWNDNYYIIRRDGSLWSMGQYNATGMLGNGTKKGSNAPVKVMDHAKAVYSSPNMGYVHVLTEDGKLYGIGGDPDFYVLGDGTKKYRTKPVLILENVKEVYNGIRRTLALTHNGELYAWGVNGKMRSQGITHWHYLGNGGSSHIKKPVKILDNVRDVCISDSEVYYAVTEDDKLWSWGGHHVKDLAITGNGKKGAVKTPTVIMEPACGIAEIGPEYVILNDRTLWVWNRASLSPTCIAENVKSFLASPECLFSTHAQTTHYYLDMDNCLWSIYKSSVVEGGDYSIALEEQEAYIPVLENVERYSCFNQCFARTTDGRMLAWGIPGSLGNGMSFEEAHYQWPPVEILLESYYPEWLIAELNGQPDKAVQRVKQVIAGSNNYVLMENGDLWGWGINMGYLGLQNHKTIPLPTVILEGVEQIYKNEHYSASPLWALMKNGDVVTWNGWNEYKTLDSITPKVVATGVKKILDADSTLVYLDQNDALWKYYPDGESCCMMENVLDYSYVNDTYIITKDHAIWSYSYRDGVKLISEGNWRQASGDGNINSYFLDADGNLYTYGYVNKKRGGSDTEITYAMSDVSELITLGEFSLVFALKNDQTLWSLIDSWDRDSNGDMYWDYRYNPKQIAADVCSFWAAEDYVYLLTTGGDLWQYRWMQQDNVTESEAQKILANVRDMDINRRGTCMALAHDGGIWLWGEGGFHEAYSEYRNEEYQIPQPVRINECPGGASIHAPDANRYLVLKEDGTLLTVGEHDWQMGVYFVPADIHTLVPVEFNNGIRNNVAVTSTPLAETTPVPVATTAPVENKPAAEAPSKASDTPEAAAPTTTYETLKQGSKGDAVLKMKQRLQELGYFKKSSDLTGKYNGTCVERVKEFQKKNGLPQTGVADHETLSLLYSDNALPKK